MYIITQIQCTHSIQVTDVGMLQMVKEETKLDAEERKRLVIFYERIRKSHCQSDEQWNYFKNCTLGRLLRDKMEHIWAFQST